MEKFRTLLLTAALAGGVAYPAYAHDIMAGDLTVAHPVIRATPHGANVAGGYMLLTNDGAESERLVGGSAEFADSVEIHEMKMDGDVMKMREIEGGLEIPPGGEVTLAPGGYHVMFIGLKQPMVAGETHDAVLIFEHAGEVEVQFQVEEMHGAGSHSK